MAGWTSKTTNATRVITRNEENRVKNITDSGNGTSFLYDDQGERVVKGGGGNETVYLNRFYSLKNGDLGSKHIFAGETRVCTKIEKDGGSIQSGVPGSGAFLVSQGIYNALRHGNVDNKRGIRRRLPGTTTGGTTTTNPPLEKFEFFYHGDHLGSSSFITDDAGSVYQELEYFPYGETWVEEGGSGQMPMYRFTGKELDPETGLYYYGARYYDPVLSRWISADPALGIYLPNLLDKNQLASDWDAEEDLPGGGGVYSPINLNLYGYVANNPINSYDIWGLVKVTGAHKEPIFVTGGDKDFLPSDPHGHIGNPNSPFKVDVHTGEIYHHATKTGEKLSKKGLKVFRAALAKAKMLKQGTYIIVVVSAIEVLTAENAKAAVGDLLDFGRIIGGHLEAPEGEGPGLRPSTDPTNRKDPSPQQTGKGTPNDTNNSRRPSDQGGAHRGSGGGKGAPSSIPDLVSAPTGGSNM